MAQGKGNDELADGISTLSGMMRYMIYESNEDRVPLKKEIEYLQNCIVLNKLRYADDEVKVIFNHPDKTEGVFVAPMLFIPFVENAFKHGGVYWYIVANRYRYRIQRQQTDFHLRKHQLQLY